MMWLARFFLLYLSYSHAALDPSILGENHFYNAGESEP